MAELFAVKTVKAAQIDVDKEKLNNQRQQQDENAKEQIGNSVQKGIPEQVEKANGELVSFGKNAYTTISNAVEPFLPDDPQSMIMPGIFMFIGLWLFHILIFKRFVVFIKRNTVDRQHMDKF